MIGFALVIVIIGIMALIVFGIAAEMRGQTADRLFSDILGSLRSLKHGLGVVWRHHPTRYLALLESVFLLLMLIPLLDNLLNPVNSTTSQWVWFLTIAPHEMGHIICVPFGQFLTVAGGSIWQILFWLLLSVYALVMRRQISVFVLFGIITGHSFINLSVYIRDAGAREMPLLFGLGKEAHDWGNLLTWTGLLDYDSVIADMALTTGAIFVVSMILLGLLAAWFMPRATGNRMRSFPLAALVAAIRSAGGVAAD